MVIVGYGPKKDGDPFYYKIKYSKRSIWGHYGYFRAEFNVFESFNQHDFGDL